MLPPCRLRPNSPYLNALGQGLSWPRRGSARSRPGVGSCAMPTLTTPRIARYLKASPAPEPSKNGVTVSRGARGKARLTPPPDLYSIKFWCKVLLRLEKRVCSEDFCPSCRPEERATEPIMPPMHEEIVILLVSSAIIIEPAIPTDSGDPI